MAHFARLDENNIVQQVIVVSDNDCLDADGNESELVGSQFCENLLGGRWIQTSYNGKIRGKYAAIYDYYDESNDSFVYAWWINHITGAEFTGTEWDYIVNYDYYTRGFRLWAAVVPADVNKPNLNICLNGDTYKYVPMDYISHGTLNLYDAVGPALTYNKTTGDVEMNHYAVHTKVVDLSDVGIIVEEQGTFFDESISKMAREFHPQTCARTAHELFRLLLEWDYAYEQFGNREPAAQRCHDAMGYLGMPDAVKQELLALVPDQAVARYIKGLEPFTGPTSCPEPPLFAEWYKTIKVA